MMTPRACSSAGPGLSSATVTRGPRNFPLTAPRTAMSGVVTKIPARALNVNPMSGAVPMTPMKPKLKASAGTKAPGAS
jgi:hypothetical protein